MKNMKKVGALLLGAAMSLSLFAGCSKQLPDITVESAEDLADLKIGVQSGTTGESTAQGLSSDPTNNVKGYKSGMDAALDLKAGGIDCIVLDELPSESIVAQNPELMIIDLGFEPEDYAIAVKKGNTELLNSINATIQRMKEDGTYDALSDTFATDDWKSFEDPSKDFTEEVKMGTNAAFAPFEFLDGTDIVGFDICMSQQIAADLGKKLKIENMEFDSLLMALQTDSVDFVAAGMSVNEDRLAEVDFSDTYFSSKQVVIVRKPAN